jgi:hypothetical protein
MPYSCQAIIRDVIGSRKFTARVFNRNDTEIYFETDTRIEPSSEVYINTYNDTECSDTDQNYHVSLVWCRALPKDANFLYGCGACVLNS